MLRFVLRSTSLVILIIEFIDLNLRNNPFYLIPVILTLLRTVLITENNILMDKILNPNHKLTQN